MRIVGIAARGDGIGEDGSFHSFAAPGDQLLADGSLVPGPHRVSPPCRHFGTCGGCQLQHVDDAAYGDFLVDRIRTALRAQQLEAAQILPPHVSPPASRRRASLKAERKGRTVRIGFNEASSHRIVDLAECPVMEPRLAAILSPLRRLLADMMPERRRATLRMTLADQGIDLLIEGIEIEGLAATERLLAFAGGQGLARLSVDEGHGAAARWEPEPVTVTLGGTPVPLPEGAFLQATAAGERELVRFVGAAVGDRRQVADLFCGLGTFALSLSAPVHAVEGARDAILALKLAAARSGRQIEAEHRDLFRRPLDTRELSRFDAVILDPPRAGAKEQVAQLARSAVTRIAYVSCNPSTFARDARTLVEGGYRLEHILPVGQFRWSTHVELAAQFSR